MSAMKAPETFVKHDADKVRLELIPAEAEWEVARAFTYGATKYPDDNYRLGTNWRRYVGALRRHLNAWQRREDNDPQSGINHLALVAANAMMLLTLQLSGRGVDDRPGGDTK